ncbi:STAS/SEC14 domain-containing protein [Hymenobacter negativus]|uniref:STAS/SEC14 domain-containing protein n=1 Tax=Hymenobacter negativus TaxID=2795026 RepID=A0ABS3QDM8_9BACT|nr:STAS/SEC14 domain-containing protein [Hymenobacter negativus]MBO2009349.1 STAS/SEC14 domain-containing protein [Hymenobacter negativus]
MLTAEAVHLTTLSDSYGAPLAEYYFLPTNAILYIRWHGHLTAAAIIRGVTAAMQQIEEHPFRHVLNDKRDTGGDWSEALPWLQYEWRPLAVAAGIRAIAYILSPDFNAQLVSSEFVEAMYGQINVSLFVSETEAIRWLQKQ